MNKADSARASMVARKANCAQTVLTSFCEELGLDRKTALKLTLGYGGGIGGMGKTCGAVTGAFMVLGLRLPLTRKNAKEMRTEIHRVIDEFKEKFIAINGSLDCKDLLGCDLSTVEGALTAKEKDLFTTICPKLVYDAVKILEGMGDSK
jgi:C_GCAxxG_C_C family probable redox protein